MFLDEIKSIGMNKTAIMTSMCVCCKCLILSHIRIEGIKACLVLGS